MTSENEGRETERTMLDRLNVRYGKFNGNGIRYTRAEHVKATLTRAVTKTTIRLTRGAEDGGIEYLAGAMRVPALTPGEVL